MQIPERFSAPAKPALGGSSTVGNVVVDEDRPAFQIAALSSAKE
jgi:hypothetical protein